MKNVTVRYLKEDEYNKWDEFVDISPQGNIFSKTYWLSAISEEYKILICEENNKILGGICLPSLYHKLYRNPKLTPQLGILLSPYDTKVKYSTKLSKDTEIISDIINNLPKFSQFDYNFSYNFTNFMPFIWENFNIDVRYTYVLNDLSDIEAIYNNFQYDVKYSIKKAGKNNIRITDKYGIEEFYNINKKTFDRQNIQMPYTLEFIKNLDDILEKHNNRKILFALDQNDNIIAGTYLLYDENCAYYLMGGADPEQRNSGVQTLLIWESIKFAATVSKKFDFEGSIVKNIERSFREFGGEQKIIHNVNKSTLFTRLVYGFAQKNKNLIRKFLKV